MPRKVSILDDALYSNDDFISPLTAVQSLKIETDEPEESDSVDVLNKKNRKLQKALELAVLNIEKLKKKNGDNTEEDGTREVNRWKRKYKQLEKHYEEADLLAKNLAEEVKELRYQIQQLQEFERSANNQIQELSDNLLATTEEIDEKTAALTGSMHEMQQLEKQLAQEKSQTRQSATMKDFKAKCTELERQLEDCTKVIPNLKSSLTEAEGRVARRDARIEKLTERNEKITKECSFLMEEVKTLAFMAGKNKDFIATVNQEGKLCAEPASRRHSAVHTAVDSIRTELESERIARQKLQEEVKKLRQKVVYTEERRKTDLHRQMQIVRGKEQESEYIWQKYVESVRDSSPRRRRPSINNKRLN